MCNFLRKTYFTYLVNPLMMKKEFEKTDPNKVEIDLLQLYQHDPEQLFTDAELAIIQNWNEECHSHRRDRPLLLTSESLWCRQQTTESRYDWCPLQVYCTVLYNNAIARHAEDEWNQPYTIAELAAFHPEIKNWKTIRKYVDILTKVGLLKEIRTSGYYQRTQTGTLGPIFETLATEGEVSNTTFVGFPDEQHQSGSTIGFAWLPSWAAVKQSFWNEYLAGMALILFGIFSTIQLFLRVYRNAAVSVLDHGIAYLLTWILLIGLFALVIGLWRHHSSSLLGRIQFNQ